MHKVLSKNRTFIYSFEGSLQKQEIVENCFKKSGTGKNIVS